MDHFAVGSLAGLLRDRAVSATVKSLCQSHSPSSGRRQRVIDVRLTLRSGCTALDDPSISSITISAHERLGYAE